MHTQERSRTTFELGCSHTLRQLYDTMLYDNLVHTAVRICGLIVTNSVPQSHSIIDCKTTSLSENIHTGCKRGQRFMITWWRQVHRCFCRISFQTFATQKGVSTACPNATTQNLTMHQIEICLSSQWRGRRYTTATPLPNERGYADVQTPLQFISPPCCCCWPCCCIAALACAWRIIIICCICC